MLSPSQLFTFAAGVAISAFSTVLIDLSRPFLHSHGLTLPSFPFISGLSNLTIASPSSMLRPQAYTTQIILWIHFCHSLSS